MNSRIWGLINVIPGHNGIECQFGLNPGGKGTLGGF